CGAFFVGVEVTLRVVGAGHHSQSCLSDTSGGQGACATCHAGNAFSSKAVEKTLTSAESGCIHFDSKVARRPGLRQACCDDVIKTLISGHFPADVQRFRPTTARQYTSPENHSVLKRITTGYAMRE